MSAESSWGSLSAPPDLLAAIRGWGPPGMGWEKREGGKGGREEEERKGKEEGIGFEGGEEREGGQGRAGGRERGS